MEIYIFILMTIAVIFSGLKFQKEIKKNEDDTRNIFVRFLLMVILYVMFIIVLLF